MLKSRLAYLSLALLLQVNIGAGDLLCSRRPAAAARDQAPAAGHGQHHARHGAPGYNGAGTPQQNHPADESGHDCPHMATSCSVSFSVGALSLFEAPLDGFAGAALVASAPDAPLLRRDPPPPRT